MKTIYGLKGLYAALLIASGRLGRNQACEHCQLPVGGTRSRVGRLAKELEQHCKNGMLVAHTWRPSTQWPSTQWQVPEHTRGAG
tara:strand:- start:843 stop:1094 length:252 start_codon:yes stop_codon:yes gene_type:complete